MNWGRKETFWTSIIKLLGHVVGSATVFVFLITVEWVLSWFLGALNAIRPLDPDTSVFALHFGRVLLYGDVVLSGVVFIIGFVRFIRDLLES
jgi:hypothetical protein